MQRLHQRLSHLQGFPQALRSKRNGLPSDRRIRDREGSQIGQVTQCLLEALIAAADAEVLAPLRRKSLDNYQLVLNRLKNYPYSADEGPVSKISYWIYHAGAKEMGLAIVPGLHYSRDDGGEEGTYCRRINNRMITLFMVC